jgi:hypothetical protein
MDDDYVGDFVRELIRAGVLLAEVLETLLDESAQDDYPGESPGEVLTEMLIGTVRPAVVSVGEPTVRAITPVFDACVQRTLGDLERALASARPES